MSETRSTPPENGQKRITELRVSGHLMTLDTGTFCVFHAPGSASGSDNALGLPGVRISLPPGPAHNPDQVSISTFRPDGWLGGTDAAALIRVDSGPAQVLVTIYQAPGQSADQAPRLQVLRLSPEQSPQSGSAIAARPGIAQFGVGNGAVSAHMAKRSAEQSMPEIIVHMQGTGDVAGRIGDWAGIRGSHNWIEGFALVPPAPLKPEDVEYQAVLGRGWSSPWVDGGQFCGSRGMALPLLGLRLRLKGEAASKYDCTCHATFVDGTAIGPLRAGEACEAESLSPLEAFQVSITPNATARASATSLKAETRPILSPAADISPVKARPASPTKATVTAKPVAATMPAAPTKPTAAAKISAKAPPPKPTKPAVNAKQPAKAKRATPPGRPAR